ncbi:MAG: hypothetical protein JKY37_21130 [Nannocystaceae bacterium]|nr:hypothetical protein [Nannocystaceae bacterium]
MSNGRYTLKAVSKRLGFVASLLAPTAALAVSLVGTNAVAAPPAPQTKVVKVAKADCHVYAVLASKEEGGIDEGVSFLAEKLRDDEFAAYKSFYAVELKAMNLKLAKMSTGSFKSGHKLSLTLLGGADKRLQLQLKLSGRDGKKQLLATKYGIDSGGVLMIRAGSDEFTHESHKGKLFFAIQCVGLTD